MESKDFPAIFPGVIRAPFQASAAVAFLLVFAACKENLSPPPPSGTGPDTLAPDVRLNPAADTLVDSTGVLLIRVRASDRSNMKHIELTITPALFAFQPIDPADTVFDAYYSIPLHLYKHSAFTYSVRAVDVLDFSVDTPPVTITVR